MSRFNLTLNGTDVSRMLHKWGVRYTPVKVRGPNTGVSQGGVVIEDLLRTKDAFVFQGNSVLAADYLALAQICAQPYATAVYKSPQTGLQVTRAVLLDLSEGTILPMGDNVWYSGWTLTMEER